MASCTKPGEDDPTFTIGLVTNNRNGLRNIKGFQDGMLELGYRVGENVNYRMEDGPLRGAQLNAFLSQLVDEKVDLIFTAGTPTGVAAHRVTANSKIPVIFGVIADPLAAGVMADLTQPGGNMTGVKLGATQARRLQFLLEMAPRIKHALVPYNPTDTASTSAIIQIKPIVKNFGIEIIEQTAANEQEVSNLLHNIPFHVDAIFLVPGTTINAHLQKLLAVAQRRRIPVSGPSLAQVMEGALMSYGFSHSEAGRQAARMADQVLKGTDPRNMPVETAEFFLAVNLKAAQAIDLEIPYGILQQAKTIVRPDQQ